MRPGWLETRTLFPRLLLALMATVVALVMPLWSAAAVAAFAALVLVRSGNGPAMRASGWMVIGLGVATIALQTLILTLFVGLEAEVAAAVGAAFSVRLGAVLLVAAATSAVLPPRSWLASLSRFPRLALVLTLVFRQVPDIAAETVRVRQAQRARGLTVGRVAALAAVVPVMTRTLGRAERMGRVLLLSGWGMRRRDPLVRPRFRASDVVWIGVALFMLAWVALA